MGASSGTHSIAWSARVAGAGRWTGSHRKRTRRSSTRRSTRASGSSSRCFRWTGARAGETCSLCWSDVDEAAGCLRVRTSKTESGVRSVPLLPELAEELQAWRRFLDQRGLYWPDGPILCTSNRTPMRAQFAWRL